MPDYNSSWSTPEEFEADIRKGVSAKGEVDALKTVARTGSYNDLTNKPTKSTFGLGNVDNTSDLNKPISTATQTALNNKVDKVSGKGLSTNDYTTTDKNKLASLSNYDDTAVVSAINDYVDKGSKNLFKLKVNSTSELRTPNKYTIGTDGIVTVEIVTPLLTTAFINFEPIKGLNGQYTLSGSTADQYLQLRRGSYSGDAVISCATEDTEVTREVHETLYPIIRLATTLEPGVYTFKPMLRNAAISSNTFAPYVPTNQELYEMILALQNN